MFHCMGHLIKTVPLFQTCSSIEQSFFIKNLKPVLFQQGDIIIQEGEIGDQMFFINRGEVNVMLQKNKKSKDYEKISTNESASSLSSSAMKRSKSLKSDAQTA